MGKRKLKNLLIGVIVLGMVMTSLQSSAWAGDNKADYSTESSLRDNTGIQDIRSYFVRAGENNKNHTQKSVAIAAKIPTVYKQNIFHYECPESGYYAIYATPGIDTVGALFEEQNYLFKPTEYELMAHNDDQFKGFGTFGIVTRLDKNEDYYACVRGYGKTTGSYNLVIETNEDKVPLPWKNSGVWEATYIPFGRRISSSYVLRKVFLNKELVALYYMMVDPSIKVLNNTKKSYTIDQLRREWETSPETVYNFLLSLVSATAPNYKAAFTMSMVGFVIGESGIVNRRADTREKMTKLLREMCGAGAIGDGSTLSARFYAEKGLVAVKWNTGSYDYASAVADPWEYHSFIPGRDYLKGEQWYVGTWTFE